MQHVIGRLILAGLLVAGVGVAVCRSPAAAQPKPMARADGDLLPQPKWMGVASCASMSCHNAGEGREKKRSEYSTWAAHDKHTQAYNALLIPRSQDIARNLKLSKPAHEEPLCLKCHAMAHTNGQEEPVDDHFYLRDGVGCESCHGPAEKWLEEHFRGDFKSKSAEEKESRYGLRNTKSLTSRVKICASCHIGSPDREVDHDLIAAGHPRMSFDFSGYLALYNKHWPVAEDRARYPDYAARTWVVGQVAGAKASLELLHARADRAAKDGQKKWPEFSEYGCYACHKNLDVADPKKEPSWKKGDPNRKPGELPWNTWYLAMAPALGQALESDQTALTELRQLMRVQGANPGEVATRARDAVQELERLLARLDQGPNKTPKMSSAEVQRLFGLILAQEPNRLKGASWDEAAQIYLGSSALYQQLVADRTNPNPRLPELRRNLVDTAKQLREAFPSGVDSPNYDANAVATFEKQMAELRNLLGH